MSQSLKSMEFRESLRDADQTKKFPEWSENFSASGGTIFSK